MKKLIIIISVICAVGFLYACGDTAKMPASDKDLSVYEWVTFAMPEGFEDAEATDTYVAIKSKADDDMQIRVVEKMLCSCTTADARADACVVDQSQMRGKAFKAGEYKWIPVKGDEQAQYFAQIDDQHIFEITAYGLTERDAAVQTVLSSVQPRHE